MEKTINTYEILPRFGKGLFLCFCWQIQSSRGKWKLVYRGVCLRSKSLLFIIHLAVRSYIVLGRLRKLVIKMKVFKIESDTSLL